MADGSFKSKTVYNRRVSDNISDLIPNFVSPKDNYHLKGKQYIDSSRCPSGFTSGVVFVECYIGVRCQFEIRVAMKFKDNGDELLYKNKISRDGDTARTPFNYYVQTVVNQNDDTKRVKDQVIQFSELDNKIYGGIESQAAVLLTEKLCNRKSSNSKSDVATVDSLRNYPSLSSVIDNKYVNGLSWKLANTLLGPEAETVVAQSGFESIKSDEEYVSARKKGIDFLRKNHNEELSKKRDFQKKIHKRKLERSKEGSSRKEWKSKPDDVSVKEAESKIKDMRAKISEMKRDVDN